MISSEGVISPQEAGAGLEVGDCDVAHTTNDDVTSGLEAGEVKGQVTEESTS